MNSTLISFNNTNERGEIKSPTLTHGKNKKKERKPPGEPGAHSTTQKKKVGPASTVCRENHGEGVTKGSR